MIPPIRFPLLRWLLVTGLGFAPGLIPSNASETGRLMSRVFLPEDYRGESQVSDVVQTPDGLIYGATLGAVHEFDGTSWRAIPVPTSWIMDLDVAPDGTVGVTGEDEFGLLEPDATGVRRYRSLVGHVPAELRPLGRLWTTYAHDGALYWSTNNVVLRWRDGILHAWPFPDNEARRSLYRGGTYLYLASTTEGLHRLDGDRWTVISTDDAVKKMPIGLLDGWADIPDVVFSLRDGSLWRLEATGAAVPIPTDLPPAIAAVEGARLTDTIRLRDGRLAILTKNAGVFLINTRGAIDLRFGTAGGVSSLNLFSASQDAEGGLWVGTGQGTFRVELDPSLTVFDQENGAPRGGMYMIARHEGRLYACGQDGLYQFTPDNAGGQGRFERVPEAAGFMPYDLLSHHSGLVVVGDAGLFRYAAGVMTHDFDAPHSLNRVALSRSHPDRIFVGGIGFIHTLRWDGRAWRDEGPIASFKEDARTLVEDEAGDLWVGTPSRGAVRVRRAGPDAPWQSASSVLFDTSRGMPEGHDWVAIYPSPLGPLITHAKGVSAYDPQADRLVLAPALNEAGIGGRYTYPLTAGKGSSIWMQLGYPPAGETPVIGGLLPAPGGGWRWRELPAGVYPALGFLGAGELIWEAAGGGEGVLWIQGQRSIVRCELDQALHGRRSAPPPLLMRQVSRGTDRLPLLARAEPALPFGRDPVRLRFASPVYSPGGTLEYQFRLRGFDERWSEWTTHGEAVFTNLPGGAYVFEARARRAGGAPGEPLHWPFSVVPQWWRTFPAYLAGLVLAAGGVWLIVRWRLGAVEKERARLEDVVRLRTEELARERDRAESANRAKTMFLASMSHELRTPLHAILGYSQLLGSDRSLPAPARERLQIVAGSGQHLLRLINEVLDLSKIEAGKLELRREPFALPALLDEIARGHESRAAAKGLGFHRPHLDGLPAVVVGDAQKLRQVIDNLLGNAVKFTLAGSVGIEVAVVEGRLRIDVSDTGPGISPGDLQRLFEPFVQAERGAASDPGTGLGLAIARRLATLMQGMIEARSGPGRGSRFRLELPLVLPSHAVRSPEPSRVLAPVGYAGPRRSILAVDDTEENRLLFRDLLAPLGFEVTLAASADEALALLDRLRPDLILLDLRMPGTSGFALARILRADARVPDVRILAASASVFGHDPTEALAAGCDAFMSKPFLPEELFARIGHLLGLTWIEAAAEAPEPAPVRLPAEFMTALRDAAGLGDVVAVREILARLRRQHPHAALGDLERAVEALDTEAVGRLASLHLDQAHPA